LANVQNGTIVAYFSFRVFSGHRRRSLGNTGGKIFWPKIVKKITKCPNFT